MNPEQHEADISAISEAIAKALYSRPLSHLERLGILEAGKAYIIKGIMEYGNPSPNDSYNTNEN